MDMNGRTFSDHCKYLVNKIQVPQNMKAVKKYQPKHQLDNSDSKSLLKAIHSIQALPN